MKRLASVLLVAGLAAFATCALAQEHEAAGKQSESHEPAGEGNLGWWKWANFAILAGGLGYLAVKNGGPFYAARARHIRKDIVEASDLRQRAEERVADVERRLANLETEIAALREESAREARAETERMLQQTMADIAKIQAQSEQEIAAAGKAARMELKRYSASLAVGLAEEKIRARMTPAVQDALVEGFADILEPASPAHSI